MKYVDFNEQIAAAIEEDEESIELFDRLVDFEEQLDRAIETVLKENDSVVIRMLLQGYKKQSIAYATGFTVFNIRKKEKEFASLLASELSIDIGVSVSAEHILKYISDKKRERVEFERKAKWFEQRKVVKAYFNNTEKKKLKRILQIEKL